MQLDLFDSPEPAAQSTVDSESGTLITSNTAPSSQDQEAEQVTYRCTGCKVVKPASDYYHRQRLGTPYRIARCKDCVKTKSRRNYLATPPERNREVRRRWSEANPDKVKTAQQRWNERNAERLVHIRWANHLDFNYGMTVEDHNRMWAEQDGKCAICAASFDQLHSRHVHVDHDHKTGAVRALLCSHCNKGIGHARENPDVLLAMAAYLLRYKNVLEMAS